MPDILALRGLKAVAVLATATPGAVRRLLAYAGYDESRSAELCTVIGEALRERTPDSFETVAAKLPLF